MAEEMREAAGEDEQELANEMAEAFLSENLPENVFGAPKAGSGMWASCIRVLDPINGETVQQINLDQNEAALRYIWLHLIYLFNNEVILNKAMKLHSYRPNIMYFYQLSAYALFDLLVNQKQRFVWLV